MRKYSVCLCTVRIKVYTMIVFPNESQASSKLQIENWLDLLSFFFVRLANVMFFLRAKHRKYSRAINGKTIHNFKSISVHFKKDNIFACEMIYKYQTNVRARNAEMQAPGKCMKRTIFEQPSQLKWIAKYFDRILNFLFCISFVFLLIVQTLQMIQAENAQYFVQFRFANGF